MEGIVNRKEKNKISKKRKKKKKSRYTLEAVESGIVNVVGYEVVGAAD